MLFCKAEMPEILIGNTIRLRTKINLMGLYHKLKKHFLQETMSSVCYSLARTRIYLVLVF